MISAISIRKSVFSLFFALNNTDKKQLTVIYMIREQIPQAGHNNCRLDDVPALGVRANPRIGT